MSEAVLNYFMHNGKIYDVIEFSTRYEDVYPSIYEVIRIVDGVPLFLEEHFERLLSSAKLSGNNIVKNLEEVLENINKMIEVNNITDYNIKIVINNLDSESPNEYYYFLKSSYPEKEQYQGGVNTILFEAMRNNPQAKVINNSLREAVNEALRNSSAYEALLVNTRQEITEGSRSNVFLIKEDKVYTAPKKDVLSGITRKRILSLCNRNNIEVLEVPILSSELKGYEALFISGTSPKVLPVRKIDNLHFDASNSTLRKIMKIYDDEIEAYIRKHK